jgi:outer membrane lipoprotein carrier protein
MMVFDRILAAARCALAILAGGLIALAVASPVAAAAGGAERLDAYLKGLDSLSAEFRQITLAADGGRMVEATGTLYLKRPGRFRWEYNAPMEQVIVADGKRVWLHDIELDQVSHQSQDNALAGTPAQLLASDDPVERHFTVQPWDAGDQRDWVELLPKAGSGDIVKIRIGFSGSELDTLLMEDAFGQLTRLSFTSTKRNPSLRDDLFKLKKSVGGDFLQF